MTDIEPISDVEMRLFELQETSNEMDNTNLDECDWVDGYNMSIEVGRKMIARIRVQDAKNKQLREALDYWCDDTQRQLIELIVSEDGCMDAEDMRLERFCDDRPNGEDTINLCFNAGYLSQVSGAMEDDFYVKVKRKPPTTP